MKKSRKSYYTRANLTLESPVKKYEIFITLFCLGMSVTFTVYGLLNYNFK